MKYYPQVNDYVKWNDGKGVEGWVYFACNEYITIERLVRPKDCENYEACCLHANERLLVLCYSDQWHKLVFIKKRTSVHET
jgi:hypothetical protein